MVPVIVILLNFVIQTTIFEHIAVYSVLPNTALIIVIIFAILREKRQGAIIGIITGFLYDMLFYDVVGTHSLVYFLIAYSYGSINNKFFRNSPFTAAVFTFIGTILSHLLYYIIMYIFGVNMEFILLLRRVIIVESIYNSILSIFIFKLIYSIENRSNLSFRSYRGRR
ncbi:rod shape-determining protein MreD [Clostridiisalibacter paucivorans]|uniref:rod shape-determining protein MreD n=1 Tax=Clostridiisalibacter paucivorans TaxID=408753 RepID=UPI001FDF4A56|nr:rod shape-determining protein MreD [Clostridiisalibacter paucivorans]